MTRNDIENLFALLQIYFPNSGKPKDKRLKSAWLLVLEPFSPEAVKTALAEHLRESTFFPDPQAIATRCPAAPKAAASLQPDAERIRKCSEWLDQFLAEQEKGAGGQP